MCMLSLRGLLTEQPEQICLVTLHTGNLGKWVLHIRPEAWGHVHDTIPGWLVFKDFFEVKYSSLLGLEVHSGHWEYTITFGLSSRIHGSPFPWEYRTYSSFSMVHGLLFHDSLLICSVWDRTMYSAKPVTGWHGTIASLQDSWPQVSFLAALLGSAIPCHSLAYSRGTLSHKPQLRGIGTFPLCGVLVYHS